MKDETANTLKECKGCPYNTPVRLGGQGEICDGYTQIEYGKCPAWRLAEIKREHEASLKVVDPPRTTDDPDRLGEFVLGVTEKIIEAVTPT